MTRRRRPRGERPAPARPRHDRAVRPRRHQPEPPHERARGGLAAAAAPAPRARQPPPRATIARRYRDGRARAALAGRPPATTSSTSASSASPTATPSARALADRGVATGVHYPLALTQQPAYRHFATVAVPGGRGVGGRVRVAAVLPRADRRRGRARSPPPLEALGGVTPRNPEVARGLGVLPLLQRRARHPEDGPRRPRRARRRASTTSRSSSSTTGRATTRSPCSQALQRRDPRAAHRRARAQPRLRRRAALRASPRRRDEWVFYTDGDAQYDASELVALHRRRPTPDIDIVQGYKLGRGDPWYRKVIGRAYHHAVRLLFRLRVRDTDCDFRLIRRDAPRPRRADVDVRRDLRRDDAQVPGRRRPLRRGRRQPLRPARTAARSSSGSRRSPARPASCWRCGGRWS